jgi:hypothetical protein
MMHIHTLGFCPECGERVTGWTLVGFDEQVVTGLVDFWNGFLIGRSLNDYGVDEIRKWSKRYSTEELLEAMKICADAYLKHDIEGETTQESSTKAFNYIPRVCANRRKNKDKPYMRDLYYIRAILRNRLNYVNKWKSVERIRNARR